MKVERAVRPGEGRRGAGWKVLIEGHHAGVSPVHKDFLSPAVVANQRVATILPLQLPSGFRGSIDFKRRLNLKAAAPGPIASFAAQRCQSLHRFLHETNAFGKSS